MSVRLSTIAANSALNGLKTSFDGCKINVYSGSQPTTPETAATGSLLGTVTLDGDGATGLIWDAAAGGNLTKPSAASWSGEWVADGTAGWIRVYESGDTDPGAAATDVDRIDMVCTRTGSSECIMSTLTAVTGASFSLNSATLTMPTS